MKNMALNSFFSNGDRCRERLIELAFVAFAPATAIRVVATARARGTAAEVSVPLAAASTIAGASPRRDSRASSLRRPRTRRLLTVPTGQREPLGRLFVRESLEGAEQDRQALGVVEPVDLLVDDRAELVAFHGIVGGDGDLGGLGLFPGFRRSV